MLKKVVLLLLISCLALTICGCGADISNNDNPPSVYIYTDVSSKDASFLEDGEDTSDIISYSASNMTSSQIRTNINSSLNSKTSNTSAKTHISDKEQRILIRQANRGCFKEIGRCDIKSSTGLYLANACASVEFDLLCKNTISLEFSTSSNSSAWLEIYVDGKLIAERTEIFRTCTVKIADNLPEGVHRVKIVRQTDADGAHLYFNAINTYGSLVEKAPDDKKLYIEAIGDDSLIGCGVRLEDDFFKDFKTSTHQATAEALGNRDATLSYPYVAAQKLDADCYILARQGAGISTSYYTTSMNVNGVNTIVGNNTESGGLLPVLYNYVTTNNSNIYTPTRIPDVIVLDAGVTDMNTNLLSQVYDNGKIGITQERAKIIAKNFLLSLKTKNPGAKIIWSYGITGANKKLKAYIQDILKRVGGEAEGFYFLELQPTTRKKYPSKSNYESAAVLLANKIRSII